MCREILFHFWYNPGEAFKVRCCICYIRLCLQATNIAGFKCSNCFIMCISIVVSRLLQYWKFFDCLICFLAGGSLHQKSLGLWSGSHRYWCDKSIQKTGAFIFLFLLQIWLNFYFKFSEVKIQVIIV